MWSVYAPSYDSNDDCCESSDSYIKYFSRYFQGPLKYNTTFFSSSARFVYIAPNQKIILYASSKTEVLSLMLKVKRVSVSQIQTRSCSIEEGPQSLKLCIPFYFEISQEPPVSQTSESNLLYWGDMVL